jgi:hypothetical protein
MEHTGDADLWLGLSAPYEALWVRLDELCARWNVAQHPLYSVRDSASERLAFVEEYDHLIAALVSVTERAAGKATGLLSEVLGEHAQCERHQLDDWRAHARALGFTRRSAWRYGADPGRATIECSRVWIGAPTRPLALDLATMYAIRGPDLALTPQRTALARSALKGVLPDITHEAVLVQANDVLHAHWSMLQQCEGPHR